ncbi:hypothetical protein KKC87_01565 [Patescibacteria group bacterium]|nr:hypothetical protein [Patescibacteria group bacterium]
MKFNKKILFFTFIYFVVRYFSYYYAPETPLHGQNLLNSIVAEFITISVIYLLCKNNPWGWYIVALEMVLGGSGAYFGIMSISLRSLLLIASLAIFFGQKISKKGNTFLVSRNKNDHKNFCFAVRRCLSGRFAWKILLALAKRRSFRYDSLSFLVVLLSFAGIDKKQRV